jgi:hypothetical protein
MIGEIAGALGGVLGIVKPLVDRAVAETIDKEHQNHEEKIQDAFMQGNADALWAVTYELLLDSGHPPTPSGRTGSENIAPSNVPGRFISNELLHDLLLTAADNVQFRKYMVKAQAKLMQ